MSETPLPDPRRALVRWLVAITVLLAPVVLTACGSGDEGPETIEIVVPLGTGDRLAAGENVVLMPARLELRVGDVLYIRNEDLVEHSVGPYNVRPDSANQFRFGTEGVYEGYCPLSEGDRYEIVVTS